MKFIKDTPDEIYLASKSCRDFRNSIAGSMVALRRATLRCFDKSEGNLLCFAKREMIALKRTVRCVVEARQGLEGSGIDDLIPARAHCKTLDWTSTIQCSCVSTVKQAKPKSYTGHCVRRTSASLLSESGATIQMIKQAGRLRYDMIEQGYIEKQ
ncbi:hypothetical protein TKK_0000128 [Trichogramma kaykai]